MPSAPALTELLPGLHATPPAPLPFMHGVVVRTFVLEGAGEGGAPVLVYNSPGIDRAADAITALDAPELLLVNHWLEEMYGAPTLPVSALVHAADRVQTDSRLPVAAAFEDRHMIAPAIEAIPTPGHTAGATAFLWQGPEHRVLFTGDSLWDDRGIREAVVLGESDRAAYLDSLALMRDLAFDAVAPWVSFEDAPPLELVARDEARERIDAVIARIRQGARA